MKRFLATTATALILGTSAYAQTNSQPIIDYQFQESTSIFASELIGTRVYATDQSIDANMTVTAETQKNWNDIGEVNDVILTRDGKVGAVIIGVGGFLGIGEKDVAIDMNQIHFVNEQDGNGDYFLVVNTSEATLKDATAFQRMDDEMKDDQAQNEQAQNEKDDDSKVNADANANNGLAQRTYLARPDITRKGYGPTETVELTSKNLVGARVYGINDEKVGEVSKLILDDSGKVKNVIIDVGGFLGLGERSVAVTFKELNILRSKDGKEFRVYIDASKKALEAQPEYKG